MPYTFGAATSDYVSPSVLNVLSANQVSMVAGWFYPTTLTAGRALWTTVAGTNNRLEIDTTTSQLRWLTASPTTQGVFTISGNAIVTNKWQFIALVSSRAGSTESLAVWQATESDPPTLMTITQVTAPAGSFVAGITFVIGNASAAATSAFQGDIGPFTMMAHTNVNNLGPLVTTSAQVIDAACQNVIQRFVIEPCWRSQLNASQIMPATTLGNAYYLPMNDRTTRNIRRSGSTSTQTTGLLTVSGATQAASRHPFSDNQTFPFDYRLPSGAIR